MQADVEGAVLPAAHPRGVEQVREERDVVRAERNRCGGGVLACIRRPLRAGDGGDIVGLG